MRFFSPKSVIFLFSKYFFLKFRMRNIRQLSLGRLSTTKIGPEDFVEYGNELEDLGLTFSSLEIIKSNAFKNVRGVKRLDLSENRIGTIEYNAFTEVDFTIKINQKFSEFTIVIVPLDWPFVDFIKNCSWIIDITTRISSTSIQWFNGITQPRH